jgi:hypothetical protein
MNNRLDNSRQNSFILFLIWPFFAVTYAVRNYKATWAKDIVWFFVIFYGFTLTLHDTGEFSLDANRYKDKFVVMAAQKTDFKTLSDNFYDEEGQSLDVLETIIIYLISRITNNTHILFAVFGLIFGYFYSRNIWYLIDRSHGKINFANVPVVITFAFIVGFWEINNFRFWTATHIFLYGALPYLLEKKRKYLIYCLLSGLMHFAYFLPIGVLGVYLITGSRDKIFFFLFIATFFLKELNINRVTVFLEDNLPDIFQPKVKTYTSSNSIEDVRENLLKITWYLRLFGVILKWVVATFLVTVFLTGQNFLSKNKPLKNLFSFTCLLYSVANVISILPSGGRFISLSNLFAVAFIFFYVQHAPRGKAIRRIIFVAIPALLFYNIMAIRMSLQAMGFFSVFGNPLISVFLDADITLIEMVKGLL